jgi:hypothetical protein
MLLLRGAALGARSGDGAAWYATRGAWPSRRIALRMVSSFRATVMSATIFSFPAR